MTQLPLGTGVTEKTPLPKRPTQRAGGAAGGQAASAPRKTAWMELWERGGGDGCPATARAGTAGCPGHDTHGSDTHGDCEFSPT